MEEIYFTGGITDPTHNEFYVEYWDDQAQRWRPYFPDFYLRLADDGWLVIEVKAADQTEHPNVKAKDAAAHEVFERLSGIFYKVIEADKARRGDIHEMFQVNSIPG